MEEPVEPYELLAPSMGPSGAPWPAPTNGTQDTSMAAPGPDPLPWCRKGQFDCLNVQLTDNAIITALWISALAGFLFLLVFATFRGKIRVFRTRLDLPSVWNRPPALPVGGFHHLWSWLLPVLTTTDMQLLHTAGLDSLMLNWLNTIGMQIFLPIAVLGLGALLPINLAGNRIEPQLTPHSNRATTSTFARLTISNLQKGSSNYWFAFVFVFIVIAYVCWLLVKYYQSYVILRQHYLTGGEEQINEWHRLFLEKRKPKAANVLRMLNVNQMGRILGDLEGAASTQAAIARSTLSRRNLQSAGSRRPPTPGMAPWLPQTGGGRQNLPTPYPHTQGFNVFSQRSGAAGQGAELSHLCAANNQLATTAPVVPEMSSQLKAINTGDLQVLDVQNNSVHDGSVTSPISIRPDSPGPLPMSPVSLGISAPSLLRRHSWRGKAAAVGAASQLADHGTQDEAVRSNSIERHRRLRGDCYQGFSEEQDEEGEHALRLDLGVGERLAQVPEVESDSAACISPDASTSASARASLDSGTAFPGKAPSQLVGPASASQKQMSSSESRLDLSPGASGIGSPIERASTLSTSTELGSSSWKISKYERNPPEGTDEGRERVHRWWHTKQLSMTENVIMGKPSVLFRKLINTQADDGRIVAVNAQQYCILVTDVPDLIAEREKLMQQARQRRWWWKLWFFFSVCFQKHVLMRSKVADPTTATLPKEPSRPAPKGERNGRNAAAPAEGRHIQAKAPVTQPKPVADIKVAIGGEPNKRPARVGDIEMGRVEQDVSLHSHRSSTDNAPLLNQQDGATTVPIPSASIQMASPFMRPSLQLSNLSDASMDAEPEQPAKEEIEDSLEEPPLLNAHDLVVETFQGLFPDTFQGVLPVHKHKEVDLLLQQWDKAWEKLAQAEARFEQSMSERRPTHRLGCCGCMGVKVDSIDYWAGRIRELEANIVAARQRALEAPPCASFFVFFSSQKDAAIAAQTNLHPEDGNSFRVTEAPGPEEVNWPMLWMSWRERELREILVLPLIVGIMLVPIGLFSGAVAQATVAICGNTSTSNVLYSEWYCKRKSIGRSIITSILPTILLMLWQNLIMPNALYRFALMEGKWPSLSSLDRRICSLFFYWSTWNVFLGAMLGGSAFSQLGIVINNPGIIPNVIGGALPTSSNFFINYIVIQGLAMQTFRLMYPHIGSLVGLFRLCGHCKPVHERQHMAAVWPHSVRYGREVGTTMLIFIMGLAYSATSPIILPFALLYFITTWIFWRYNMLYVSERCFESGGLIWDNIFDQLCWCLFILEFFTGCIFLANAAYVQATLMWFLLTPFLFKFNRYCHQRFGKAVQRMPLETAAAAPAATVDPAVYLPPALRPGSAGWYPECGKAWEHWNAPSYTL
ncbi:probable CSC1-like protein ERD4 at C-terminar half [Coccomyxa sp. Obi]|nr:probable CSC1-like protein ERD4 at C-terminar half [Coccomyxa sp. Obi]